MSVYVSITCYKYDRELISTINSCLDSASGDVHIGLEYCGDIKQRDYILDIIKNKPVSFMYTPEEKNTGIGMGRNNAASLYNGEDYFLQIDSHIKFENKWDIILIEKFNNAKKIIKNNKIILTGNLGDYEYTDYDKNEYISNNFLLYTKWLPKEFIINNKYIPKWKGYTQNKTPKEIQEKIDNTGFAPASKIVAMFMFSDHNLAKDICLPINVVFWEEEIIQTIELIDSGFTLVHPGEYIPLLHFYGYDLETPITKIRHKDHLGGNAVNKMIDNFNSYVNDSANYNKIKKFENYVGFNIIDGPDEVDLFPKDYINI